MDEPEERAKGRQVQADQGFEIKHKVGRFVFRYSGVFSDLFENREVL